MNKLELIQVLKDKTKLNKQEASEVVRLFFDSFTQAMVKGKRSMCLPKNCPSSSRVKS
jgi:integration host factor subunit beta